VKRQQIIKGALRDQLELIVQMFFIWFYIHFQIYQITHRN